MKHLLKSWLPPVAGTKKFLAANLAHRISRILNRRKFEVVVEGYLDLHNSDSEQPDIIVYEKDNGLKPVMMIELCGEPEYESTTRTMEILSGIYRVKESFVFHLATGKWLKTGLNHPITEESAFSSILKASLMDLLYQQDQRVTPKG